MSDLLDRAVKETMFVSAMPHVRGIYNEMIDRIKELEAEIKDHAQWAERMMKDPDSEPYRKLLDTVKELEAQLEAANKRADKAAQDGWLKTAETQLARAKKAEATIARVEELTRDLTEPDDWRRRVIQALENDNVNK